MKIYPYADVERGTIRWYSFSDKLPHDAPYEQWLFYFSMRQIFSFVSPFRVIALRTYFVGAVWANVSWGRYWGWDPKEVWALITMLVYSAALHSRSLRWLKKPLAFNIYCVAAFVTVLITYFGVNFILGGMHGYA